MNTAKLAFGGALIIVSLIGMGYVQSLFLNCDQLGEIISDETSEFPTANCIGFNILESLIIFAAFVGVIVVILGLLD